MPNGNGRRSFGRDGQRLVPAWRPMEKTFKETLIGDKSFLANVPEARPKAEKITIPQVVVLRSNEWLSCCLVGEIKDLELLSKCMSMIQVYGLGDCKVRYIGGLCVILEFKTKVIAECFLRNQQINWAVWFAWLKCWDDNFRQMSRIVWLRVYGVPIRCWDPNAFTCIAGKYGRVLVPFECSSDANNMSFGRICVLTSHLDHIEPHAVTVEWNNISFKARILEDGEYPNSLIVPSDDEELGMADFQEDSSSENNLDGDGDEGDEPLPSPVWASLKGDSQNAPVNTIDGISEEDLPVCRQHMMERLETAHDHIPYATKLGSTTVTIAPTIEFVVNDNSLKTVRLSSACAERSPDYDQDGEGVGDEDTLGDGGLDLHNKLPGGPESSLDTNKRTIDIGPRNNSIGFNESDGLVEVGNVEVATSDPTGGKSGISNRNKLTSIRLKDVLFNSNISKVKGTGRQKTGRRKMTD
ncbi:hypothetical protein LXL04_005666 [Taraxacum kok-saghyz]